MFIREKFETNEQTVGAPNLAVAGPAHADIFDRPGQNEPAEAKRQINSIGGLPQPVVRPKFAVMAGMSNRRVGEATVRELAQRGYRVLVCDRDDDAADICRAIAKNGCDVEFVRADATSPQGVEDMLSAIDDRTSRVDLLVINVSATGDRDHDNLALLGAPRFRRILDLNLVAPFQVAREALNEYMLPQRSGVVIFLGAATQETDAGTLGRLGFRAGETALSALVAGMQEECGPDVRIHLLRPGVVADREAIARRWRGLDPTGLLAEPYAVAQVIALLASDEARLVRGIELVVGDGGSKTKAAPATETGADAGNASAGSVTDRRDQSQKKAA